MSKTAENERETPLPCADCGTPTRRGKNVPRCRACQENLDLRLYLKNSIQKGRRPF